MVRFVHAAGYGLSPRTKLCTSSAVFSVNRISQSSLKIFGAGRSSASSGCGVVGSAMPWLSHSMMRSTVRSTTVAPNAIRRSCTEPTFSSSPMAMRSCMIRLPVSISCLSRKVVTPVSLSPFMTAQLIGAAPRYWGRREAWRLNVPSRGIAQTTSGNMRNATTICRSARYERSSSRKASSFSFSGCRIGSPASNAYFFTSEYCT